MYFWDYVIFQLELILTFLIEAKNRDFWAR